MTDRGDCIVAIGATCGPSDLPFQIKQALSKDSGRAILEIRVDEHYFEVQGKGADGLTFENSSEMVVRKSGFISDRTLMVHASGAAYDIPRSMVSHLQTPKKKVTIRIILST